VLGLISSATASTSRIFRSCRSQDSPSYIGLNWISVNGDAQKPLRLIIDGYTDYFTATSMYAADQAGIKVIPP